ncbi:MAG TPA: tetratricopeptide repeat protein [Xanthobacteraceae bacterium]|nr:tetratricopeptide repeat protein [Xanthobacteraceae bacterium]
MSDIFQEVDEEVRRERLKQLWDQYGGLALALALVIVALVGGWRGHQWWEAKKSAEAGSAFEAAVSLSEQGKHAEAEAAFAKIATESPPGYKMLGRFREAAALAQRDPQAAVKLYDVLAADSSIGQVLQDLAAVRAGLILVDTATYNDIVARLEPLTAKDRAFRHTAREVLALSAWKTGNTSATRHWFDMIVTDAETPAGTRSRVEMLMALAPADAKS